MGKSKLTPKQRRFVDEYLVDLNATQAAIRAGYSAKTAEQVGFQLLQKTSVRQAVETAQAERSERTQVTTDYVIRNLIEVVERCMQREPVFDMKGKHVTDENGNHLWKFNDRGANKALELLGKHTGMFTERVDHTSSDGSMSPKDPVVIDVSALSAEERTAMVREAWKKAQA